MQAVAGRDLQIVKTGGKIDIFKSPSCPLQQIGWQSFRLADNIYLLRMPVLERLDHDLIVTRHVTRVKYISRSHTMAVFNWILLQDPDKDGNIVFLAESDWVLRNMVETNPEIKFHFTSEFKREMQQTP